MIGDIRDVVIIINGVVLFGLLVLIAVLIFLIYKKITPILESARVIAARAEIVAASVTEVAKPLILVGSLIRGLRRRKQAKSQFEEEKV